jgi:small subunit ribosomal protein S9
MTDEPTPTSGSPQPQPEQPEPAPTPALTPTPIQAPSTESEKPKVVNPYTWGTGRRKTAIARVRIRPGDGKFLVNKREVDEYFKLGKDRQAVRTPLQVTDTGKTTDVFVNICGGGISGQAGAILLGLARALAKADPVHEPKLREQNLLTRDPRKVERKKYGQRGARRRFQFSKR